MHGLSTAPCRFAQGLWHVGRPWGGGRRSQHALRGAQWGYREPAWSSFTASSPAPVRLCGSLQPAALQSLPHPHLPAPPPSLSHAVPSAWKGFPACSQLVSSFYLSPNDPLLRGEDHHPDKQVPPLYALPPTFLPHSTCHDF